jgi:hypothetical protein
MKSFFTPKKSTQSRKKQKSCFLCFSKATRIDFLPPIPAKTRELFSTEALSFQTALTNDRP